jgi:hypothetical protein
VLQSEQDEGEAILAEIAEKGAEVDGAAAYANDRDLLESLVIKSMIRFAIGGNPYDE